jgi:hypothetical protein
MGINKKLLSKMLNVTVGAGLEGSGNCIFKIEIQNEKYNNFLPPLQPLRVIHCFSKNLLQ